MKVLFTDTRMPEIGLERKFFADAGIELNSVPPAGYSRPDLW